MCCNINDPLFILDKEKQTTLVNQSNDPDEENTPYDESASLLPTNEHFLKKRPDDETKLKHRSSTNSVPQLDSHFS